jgi:hypothetical protein
MHVTYKEPMPGHLRETVKLLMESSRVTVNSGGPIGYLDPDPVD